MKTDEQNKSIIELIKYDELKVDLNRLLESDYDTDSPYGIFYSLCYKDNAFSRKQFIWFSELEEFKNFLLQQVPLYYAVDIDLITENEITEEMHPFIERYFESPTVYEANIKAYKNSIKMMFKINDYKALNGAVHKFLGFDPSDKNIAFNALWVGNREYLMVTKSSILKHMRDEIKKDFTGNEDEFLKYFSIQLFILDFVQKSFEDLIGFEPFKYDSLIKIQKQSESNEIGETMIEEIFLDYSDGASKYVHDYIIHNYVNFKRYK